MVVPTKDDDITAPDPKKRKLDVQLAGRFASSVMCLVALMTYKRIEERYCIVM